jgi:hypothetical protein
VATIKAGEPQVLLRIEKHKSASLSILELTSQLFLSVSDTGPPRKLLFKAYQARL